MKIVVVGGVAGGATAIARLRRLDEKAEIVLLERGKYVSFANCGLPYYVGGSIAQRDALFVATPESIEAKYGVVIRTEHEVLSIDRENKTLEVKDLQKGETYTESYDKLLLSTGSRPFVPPVEGTKEENVFQLWTIPDVDAIDAYIRQHQPKRAVVVGGGFIGLEMAENLVDRGMDVTLVEMAKQVMPPLDEDMAKLVANHLEHKGVHLELGEGFNGTTNQGHTVLLQSGRSIDTDLVLLSIGVRPNSELAAAAGLELNGRKGIRVNAAQQTSDPDIYAVGDVTGVEDYVLGGETMIPLAGPANKQGRNVAENMLGVGTSNYAGTMGTSVAKVFDLTVAAVGANEKALQRAGKKYGEDYQVTMVHPMSHAGYYPGAVPMSIKLVFGTDRKVLGAQIVGYDGVDKRIDTIATTIHFHGTVDDLTNLELAYAPPYSSAKDPVNFAGYVAKNILDGLSAPVLYREWKEAPEKYQLLDVREEMETVSGILPGAQLIPLSELRGRIAELKSDKPYLVYCAVGLRGYVAERILQQNGIPAHNLVGGYRTVMDMEETGSDSGMQSTEQDRLPVTDKAAANQPARVNGAAGIGAAAGASSPASVSAAGVGAAGVSAASADSQEPARQVQILNVCGMSCPGPIVQVSKAMADLKDGDVLEVTATDPGFVRDIDRWSENTGNRLLARSEEKGTFKATLQKGRARAERGAAGQAEHGVAGQALTNPAGEAQADEESHPRPKEKTMIVFDGDLDKAIASFIIATGAAAMGNKVHMFFTFWGLSVLRKPNPPKVKKDFLSKMFGFMLPTSSKKLGTSKMNFWGAGAKMIRGVMDKKGISSLEELIRQAQEMGVEMTACQMSMDVMGITKEELIDGVKIGGVATMLADSDQSDMNLFI